MKSVNSVNKEHVGKKCEILIVAWGCIIIMTDFELLLTSARAAAEVHNESL